MKKVQISTLILACLGMNLLFAQTESNFYDVETIQDISISFEEDNWQYLLDSLRVNGSNFHMGKIAINGNEIDGVGVQFKASRSYAPGNNRNGIVIKLGNKDYQGFKNILLSNALRDPSMVREVLAYEIARQYMPAPRANYAKVSINGEHYGLFANIQMVDEVFFAEHYGSANGTHIMATPNWEEDPPEGCKSIAHASLLNDSSPKCLPHNFTTVAGEDKWNELADLTNALNSGSDQLNRLLNVDATLWMLAFNNLIVNLRSYTGQYSQNYGLYLDEQGRFQPLIGELNLAFGSYKNTGNGSDLKFNEMQEMDPLLHMDNQGKPLISKLLADGMNKKKYLSHLRTMLKEQVLNGRYEQRAQSLQTLIGSSFQDDPNKYYSDSDFTASLTSVIGKRSRIPGIVTFMGKRGDFLRKSPKLAVLPPKIAEIEVLKREQFSQDQVKAFNIQVKTARYTKKVFISYRFDESDEFMLKELKDDGNSKDEKSEDGIFGIQIMPPAGKDRIEYYLMAENAKAVSYSPTRYTNELHSADLESLNK